MYQCFVVMGYGKKTDYKLSRVLDLDFIYNNLIKPVLSSIDQIESRRGDEVSGSEIIDTSMFELLLSADIVVADITTLNPNAIYELGIRHALKPYSTIILSLDKEELPFDFNHNRILQYQLKDLHNSNLLRKKKEEFKKLVEHIIFNLQNNFKVCDSPFYEYVKDIQEPKISSKKLEEIKKKNYGSETIKKLLDEAKDLKKQKKYLEASEIFKKLAQNNKSNPYYLQQQALFLSKVKDENKLLDAEKIMRKLKPNTSLDSETTGIYGAIEKRLFKKTLNPLYLNNALNSYNRGFILNNDYYNGENVVNCLFQKLLISSDIEELIYLKYRIQRLNNNVLNLAIKSQEQHERNDSELDYWPFATISVAYLTSGEKDKYTQFRDIFMSYKKFNWEQETFEDTVSLRKKGQEKFKQISATIGI